MHLLLAALLSLGHATSLAPECSLFLTPEALAVTNGLNRATPALASAITRGAAPGNLLFAPVNVLQALQALYPADGPIQPNVARELGLGSLSRAEALFGMRSVNNVLNQAGEGTKLKTSVSVWANEAGGFRFDPKYVEDLKRTFRAVSESLDFRAPASLERVNGHVAAETDQMIERMLDRLDPALSGLLITTLFIQGSWANPFDHWNTEPAPFRSELGGPTTVDMMKQVDEFNYGENADGQYVHLKTEDGRATMEVFLPRTEGRRHAFAGGRLTTPALTARRVRLELPRFKTGWKSSIMKALDEMVALGRLAIVDKLYVTDVLHVTELEVWEQGFRGAAATAMTLEFASAGDREPPVEMKVDRSFGLRILVNDGPHAVELFRGWVDRPEAFTPPGAGSSFND